MKSCEVPNDQSESYQPSCNSSGCQLEMIRQRWKSEGSVRAAADDVALLGKVERLLNGSLLIS